jgi:hypothetical protein
LVVVARLHAVKLRITSGGVRGFAKSGAVVGPRATGGVKGVNGSRRAGKASNGSSGRGGGHGEVVVFSACRKQAWLLHERHKIHARGSLHFYG